MKTPSQKIDDYISELNDWRGKTLAELREVILDADSEMVEEWKWMGTPTWYHHGIIACANAHKGKVKITFDYGARIADPKKLFNAGLEGNQRRAIDLFEGDKIDKRALKALILAAIAFNVAKKAAAKPKATRSKPAKK